MIVNIKLKYNFYEKQLKNPSNPVCSRIIKNAEGDIYQLKLEMREMRLPSFATDSNFIQHQLLIRKIEAIKKKAIDHLISNQQTLSFW